MVDHEEILSSLTPLNGRYFNITDLNAYAAKLVLHGRCLEQRLTESKELIAYILFYDNQEDVFISMAWTHPDHQGRGYANNLLRRLIHATTKNIRLEVNKDNPAKNTYLALGFKQTSTKDGMIEMVRRSALAIMQPYTFPHLGYFHLAEASNLFIFYDDVNYIKKGWVNRNRILANGNAHLLTVPLQQASQNRSINETRVSSDDNWAQKFDRTIIHSYQNAPFFQEVHQLIKETIFSDNSSIADLAIRSIVNTYRYLGLALNHDRSSSCSPMTKDLGKAERLIQLCKQTGFARYVNSPGGAQLYCKDHFKDNGIELGFIDSDFAQYAQFKEPFTPSLSIIDVLMFNEPARVRKLLASYEVN